MLQVDQANSSPQWYVDQLLQVIQGKALGIQSLAEQAEAYACVQRGSF